MVEGDRSRNTDIWRLRRQKQVSQVGISNYIVQFTVAYNYLSLPAIPASGAKVRVCQPCYRRLRYQEKSNSVDNYANGVDLKIKHTPTLQHYM